MQEFLTRVKTGFGGQEGKRSCPSIFGDKPIYLVLPPEMTCQGRSDYLNTGYPTAAVFFFIIKIKIHSNCEIEDFVETHLCKLCVILRVLKRHFGVVNLTLAQPMPWTVFAVSNSSVADGTKTNSLQAFSLLLHAIFLPVANIGCIRCLCARNRVTFYSSGRNDPWTSSDWPTPATIQRWPHFREVDPILATQPRKGIRLLYPATRKLLGCRPQRPNEPPRTI